MWFTRLATPGLSRPALVRVLESAARRQTTAPDAILVGDSAAAPWASHRTSFDHDHVLGHLIERVVRGQRRFGT